jgi:hypothetical protein
MMIEDEVPLRSAPMPDTGTSSRGGEFLDDELINPAVMSLNMESWHCTKQWVRIRCEYLE